LALTDAFDVLTFSVATVVTVPPNSSVAFGIPTSIDIIRTGTGLVSFAAGTGVTINSKNGIVSLNDQWAGATLVKTGTNTWDLVGVGVTLPTRQTQITSSTTTTSTTWVTLLTTTWTTNIATAFLLINFTVCANCSNTNAGIYYQITLDGTDIGVCVNWVASINNPTSAALSVRVACTGNASHTVVVNWRTSSGTATVDPTQTHSTGALLMHANAVISEVQA
jgi:hypothetical protein